MKRITTRGGTRDEEWIASEQMTVNRIKLLGVVRIGYTEPAVME